MPDYFESGFSVRQPMWHGKGFVPDRHPENWDEARKWAGLEWEPEVVPAYVRTTITAGGEVPAGFVPMRASDVEQVAVRDEDGNETGAYTQVAGLDGCEGFAVSDRTRLVLRDDTRGQIGDVGTTWEPMYHRWMGDIIEAILGQGAVLETGGSSRGGSDTWALARLDEPVEVAGDDSPTYPYLALLNSHDGSGAVKVLYTNIRVVCWNTYSMASLEGDRTGHQYIFRHGGDMASKVEAAKQTLKGVRESFDEWKQLAEALAQQPVDDKQVRTFTDLFIPMPEGEVVSDRVKDNVAKARGTFRRLYDESVTTDGHRGNALGLFDASVEYLDHVRKAMSRDTLMNRTLLRPEPLKRAALSRLITVTGADIKLPEYARA